MRLVAEARQARQYQLPTAATEATPGEFVARRTVADAALVESAGEGIAAKEHVEAFRTKDGGTIWNRRPWAVLKLIFGGNKLDGTAFDPKTDLNSYEYQSSLHHSLGGGWE